MKSYCSDNYVLMCADAKTKTAKSRPKLASRSTSKPRPKTSTKVKTDKDQPKPKRGRPSKKDSISKNQLESLYRHGYTDKEVAQFFNISRESLQKWKAKDLKLFKNIKDWKNHADEHVERTLYERAVGGQWGGKEYPPETVACIFWLKNRKPAEWRDRVDHKVGSNFTIEIKRFGEELPAPEQKQIEPKDDDVVIDG